MRYVIINEHGTPYGLAKLNKIVPEELFPGVSVDMMIPIEDEEYPAGKIWDGSQFVEPSEALSDEQKATRVMFRAMAQMDAIGTKEVLDNAGMFPEWRAGEKAVAGEYWRHKDVLYRVVQEHTTQDGWEPDKVPALFTKADDPKDEWPEWIQPTGAHNAYSKGDKVSHIGEMWVSDVDGNTWTPGAYGWSQM